VKLRLRGLRAGNLKNFDLNIDHGHWTAVHGPSGAGKSALLFGVLEPIARRRFKVLYDSAALPGGDKQWLSGLCDELSGMQPVVCLAGEVPRGRRKKLLINALNLWPRLSRAFALHGQRHCANCDHQWQPQSAENLLEDSPSWASEIKVLVFSQADNMRSEDLLLAGWTRVRIGNNLTRLEEAPEFLPNNSWLLLDRLKWQSAHYQRVKDALLDSARRGGDVLLDVNGDNRLQAAIGRCPSCGHCLRDNELSLLARLSSPVESWVFQGKSWSDWTGAAIEEIAELPGEIMDDCDRRLLSLVSTGMGHLQADRILGTLSLGESRRLELCSVLSQVRREQLVLFDEPGMGLHGSERRSVVKLLRELVRQGNTVITADPAREFLEGADNFVRLGPGGGPKGGCLVATGPRIELPSLSESLPALRQLTTVASLEFANLKTRWLDIPMLKLPLQQVVAICGVSGCGKSTLLEEELLPRLRNAKKVKGELPIGGAAVLLERALGSAAVSTVATLSGAWTEIRKAFAEGEEGRIRGLSHSDLVAKTGQGACHLCRGHGLDVDRIPCQLCAGLGLREDLLELRLRNKSLRDWLTSPLSELQGRLPHTGRLRRLVKILCELGMEDRCFGERGRNLSLGERSRIALAKELASSRPGIPRLFLLDEPCLGLPPEEAVRVVEVLRRLSSEGHSFWVVEHNEVLLRCADHILELGPGAGPKGGQVVFNQNAHKFPQAETATALWLQSRIKGEAMPEPPSPIEKAQAVVVAEDFTRKGRKCLEHDLMRELATRSPLAADLLAGQSALGKLQSLPPVAWPTDVPPHTSLFEILGLAGSISHAMHRSGEISCANCGDAGAWMDLAEAAQQQLTVGEEYHFVSELNVDFDETNLSALLAAAGFRRLLIDGQRKLITKQVTVKFGSPVLLDTCRVECVKECSERLREAEHHAKLLSGAKVMAIKVGELSSEFSYVSGRCRKCEQGDLTHKLTMEARLAGRSEVEISKLSLGEALTHMQSHAAEHGPFMAARKLLAGTSLLRHPGALRVNRLTELELKLARLVGWLLYPVEGIFLLHDQALAGFPNQLAKRLRSSMLKSLHRFTDAERGIDQAKIQATKSLGACTSEFSLEFDLNAWSYPTPAKPEQTLRQALGLEIPLREQFLACEEARLRAWQDADLRPGKQARYCPKCHGKCGHYPHPQIRLTCDECNGLGWDRATRSLEIRGLSWFELGRMKLHDLHQHFLGSPSIEKPLKRALDFGMGAWLLDQNLRELPVAAASLAAFAGLEEAEEVRLALPLAGCSPLEAEQISVTMHGFLADGLDLEIKGNHPCFVTK